MGVFRSFGSFPHSVPDLEPVARDLMAHFSDQEFEVEGQRLGSGGWSVSISKGGMFKAIAGLKTALQVEIRASAIGTTVDTKVGIFGRQGVPAAIGMLFLWPLAVTAMWGAIKQSSMDDEAIRVVGQSLEARASGAQPAGGVPAAAPGVTSYCSACSAAVPPASQFCPECGQAVAAG